MYCSACGVAVAQGLSYCNHCGAKLNGEKGTGKPSELKAEVLVSSIVATFVVGLAAISLFVVVMKSVLAEPFVVAFTMLSFMIMLMIEGLLIGLLLTRNRRAKAAGRQESSKEQSTKELDAAQTKVLPEAMQSVTEHTTRSFEPLYSERKTK